MKKVEIDIRLERDPRYEAAKAKLIELQLSVVSLESQRSATEAELATAATVTCSPRITAEAAALLTGVTVENGKQNDLRAHLGEITHRLAVVRQALKMQREIVDELASEVGAAIARDMLPKHKSNVEAVVEAALQLNTALEAEMELRDTLTDNGVQHSGVLRPMPMSGFGRIADDQSRVSRYLLEAVEYGFVPAASMPDVVRDRIPKPQKVVPPQRPARRPDNDGWINA